MEWKSVSLFNWSVPVNGHKRVQIHVVIDTVWEREKKKKVLQTHSVNSDKQTRRYNGVHFLKFLMAGFLWYWKKPMQFVKPDSITFLVCAAINTVCNLSMYICRH